LQAIDGFTRRHVANRWFVSYIKVHPSTGAVYVGMCSGEGSDPWKVLSKYDASHRKNKDGFGPAQLDRFVSGLMYALTPNIPGNAPGGVTGWLNFEISARSAIRGREQQLYDFYKQAGFTLGNINRPVSQYNIFGRAYWLSSNYVFGEIAEFTGKF
jgi:hypothetical protein